MGESEGEVEFASRRNLVWRKPFDKPRHFLGVGMQLRGSPIEADPIRRTVGDAAADNHRVRKEFDPIDSQLHAVWMCCHGEHFEYLRP